jgi:ribonuclease G
LPSRRSSKTARRALDAFEVFDNLSSEILISSDPWENRVAILEDGHLAELYIEREEKVIGSIFKGKVQNVLPGMGAAFVDIGLGRNAFLYVDDINKQPLNIGDVEVTSGRSGFTITDKVKKGDDALVQIVKEPRGLKGARISTNVSLPGRYLILMPTGRYSGVSRKIESVAERDRLKAVLKRIRPEGMATVVRTAAAGVSEAELIADLGVLIRMWHGILETYKRAASPSLLHKDMNLVYKAARDFITADVDKVLIDSEPEFKKVRDFLQLLGPQYIDRLEYYNSGRSLFDDYRVNEELEKLMKSKVNLVSGGSIVIESTEALTVIDVNSGKFTGGKNLEDTIVKTNIEAAAEIARQVRLRDIGGIIVVDFIDMSTESARNKVIKTLEDGLRRDRTRSTIQSFSNLGLLEFTRKRIGKDLGAQLQGSCPTCSGLGSVLSAQSVAIDTLRHVRNSASKGHQATVVRAAPTVAAQLDFWYEEERETLARELDAPIHVRVDPMLHPERFRIEHVTEFKEEKSELVRVGDEHTVELLPGRLPNATSAAAVVSGHIVEVEHAANNAGNSARIRILDVDEDYVLAELLSADVKSAEAKKKRRRGVKRKGPLTATEQAAQLRELAKEASEQSQARPPIGITTVTEEEERLDKARVAEARAERTVDAIVISEGEVQHGEAESEGVRRRRRRRRRGRGGSGATGVGPAAVGIPPQSAQAQVEFDDEDDEAPAQGSRPSIAGEPAGEGGPRRRRRRRRGRGRGRAQGEGQPQQPPRDGSFEPLTGPLPTAVPDRHIFRVNPAGNAQATGETAPREPSRAIALRRRIHPPAVNAPPPSLKAPAEKVRATKPARPRRGAGAGPPGELEGSRIAALPPAPSAAPTSKLVRAKPKSAVPAKPPAKPVARKPVTVAAKKPAAAKPKRAPAKAAAPKATARKRKTSAAAPSKRKN